MNKLKKEKGITLVALIITIVVLLILAAVAIGAVKNSDIIGYAQNAAEGYETEKGKENEAIKDAEDLLNKYATAETEKGELKEGLWELQEDGETIKNGKTGETKKIGDTFTNDEVLAATGGTKSSYAGTWTILGVENGKLKLVSTTNVTSTDVPLGHSDENVPSNLKEIYNFSEENNLNLEKAIWSYNNAVNTLNKHAKDLTGITSARSIIIEDIEAKDVLNITEEQKRTLDTSYGRTYRFFYEGYTETRKINSQYLDWNEIDTEAEDTEEEGWKNDGIEHSVFISNDGVIIDGTDANKSNVVKLKYNYYDYMNAFTDTKFANFVGNGNYWLASTCVDCSSGNAGFYVPYVENGDICNKSLFGSYGWEDFGSNGVRAIVYI